MAVSLALDVGPYPYYLIETPWLDSQQMGSISREPVSTPQPEARAQQPPMGLILATVTVIILSLLVGLARMQGLASANDVSVAAVEMDVRAINASIAATSDKLLSPVFSAEIQHWAPQILVWAEEHNLDPDMVATIMQIESCGDPNAVSSAGAQGLFQVMPFHFAADEDMQDPNTNARRGMTYLSERLAQTDGDYGRAFAGYNGGHVAAAGSWDSWAAETQRYYTWSTGIYNDASQGLTSSPTLADWLAAGGASLCRQAAARLGLAPASSN